MTGMLIANFHTPCDHGIPSTCERACGVQNSADLPFLSCEIAAGKVRKKWQARAGTKFVKPGNAEQKMSTALYKRAISEIGCPDGK